MTNVTYQVKVDEKLSAFFATIKGLRHWDGLACHPNRALVMAIRDSRMENLGTIFYKSTQILLYAYDIDIIGLRLFCVAEAYQRIGQAAEYLGLQINEAPKTKLMLATTAALPTPSPSLRRHDVLIVACTFDVVQEFICLK